MNKKLNFYEVEDEYNLYVPKFKKIIKNANVLYKQVMQYNMQIKERCCRYRFLRVYVLSLIHI